MLELKRLLVKVKNRIVGTYPKMGFARSGEDIVLEQIFPLYKKGFYVDIGSYHPIKHSNTYRYYLSGWHGLNIDPNLRMIQLFSKMRPRDVSLNIAIGANEDYLDYYDFLKDPSQNTISFKQANLLVNNDPTLKYNTYKVKVDTLKNILSKHVPSTQIDFMSVDVEGFDLVVLQSNDWKQFRPKVVLVEVNVSLDHVLQNEIYLYMKSISYGLLAYTPLNSNYGNIFFIDKALESND